MKLEDQLRQNLLGHLSDANTTVDVNIASKIARQFALGFHSFLRENYHMEDEAWSYLRLPKDSVQDKNTYEIIGIEKALEIYETSLTRNNI